MGRLIVNADDFGLTAGVNRAIAELNRAGLLTSATLMARATATAEAIEIARRLPALSVGCHVVLVDGDPVMRTNDVQTLVDSRTGRLYSTLSAFLPRLMAGRIRPAEIEAEAAAQIATLQRWGSHLTHIDTHKHTHMFPAVLRPLLRAAAKRGIRAVRNPFDPEWSVRATLHAPWLRRSQVRWLRRFEPAFRRIVTEEGFTTTQGSIGVLATGTLDAATIDSLLRNLPPGAWELVTHPGYNDGELARIRTRLTASRDTEREALRTLDSFPAIERISFADLLFEEPSIRGR